MGHVRLLVALVLLAGGCGKHLPPSGAARGTELSVWVYETFPPEGGAGPVRFRLSRAELDRIAAFGRGPG